MSPYAALGALMAVVALCVSSAQVGRTMERSAWQAKEIDSTNRLVHEAETQRAAFAQLQKANDEKHEAELRNVHARWRADAGKRVPIGAEFCMPASASSQTTGPGGTGQAPSPAQFLPESFAGDLRQLAADADAVIADARATAEAAKDAGVFMGYDAK